MKHPFLTFKLKNYTGRYKPRKCSTKIRRLFAKHAHTNTLKEHELELIGLLDMADGLEYHHKNFVKIEKRCRKIYEKIFTEKMFYSVPSKNIHHEAIAYLNRLGQVFALITSDWFKKRVNESDIAFLCPIVLALIPFRHKFGAHRSIDNPKKETDSQKGNHASLPFGLMWIGRNNNSHNIKDMATNLLSSSIGYQLKIAKNEKLNRSPILQKHHPLPIDEIEIFTTEEIFITFTPTKHHDKICHEIIKVIEKFFT